MANNSFECCCHVLPAGSLPEVVAGIVNYLNEHPGWSENELNAMIKPIKDSISSLEKRVAELEAKSNA